MILEKTFQNGEKQTYTVLSYRDLTETDCVIVTSEYGEVAISQKDVPEVWQQFMQQKGD